MYGLNWGRGLRQTIGEQCRAHPGACELLECDMECACTRVLAAQLRAKFCLQPGGDSPTRRSLFDSLQWAPVLSLSEPFESPVSWAPLWAVVSNRLEFFPAA